jgi:hypothetical protein
MSPDQTNALLAQANGFVKICQIPPVKQRIPQMCPPTKSSILLIEIIQPSPPNGDLNT